MGEKQKMTVSLDSDVIEGLKIAAIRKKTNVSAILETLAKEYLKNEGYSSDVSAE